MEAKKILLVEDDQFLRELYMETLSGEGYTLEVAVDGEDALQKLLSGGWDLVLLDIMLPKLSGLDIMRKILSEKHEKPSKSIVFLTNLDNDQDMKEALTLGNGYLIKSQMTPDQFLTEVKQFLSKI